MDTGEMTEWTDDQSNWYNQRMTSIDDIRWHTSRSLLNHSFVSFTDRLLVCLRDSSDTAPSPMRFLDVEI